MAATTTLNENGSVTLDDGEGHSVIVSLNTTDIPTQGWVTVDVLFGDGIHQNPIRLKITDSGGRIGADHPTCNSAYCIVDESGRIAGA